MTSPLNACLDLLSHHTGIKFDRPEFVQRVIAQRAEDMGLADLEEYADYLASHLPQETRVLAPVLTVGETFFMRDRKQLQAVVAMADELIRRHRPGELRVWSAGCATGEEPYSLAIVLDPLTRQRGVELRVLATDINPKALEAARRGVYRGRPLRLLEPHELAGYFVPEGDDWRVADEVRRRVKFCLFNLAEQRSSPVAPEFPDFHLIICRNVFIYLRPESIRIAMATFHHRLVDYGALFLGHTEAPRNQTLFRSVRLSDSCCFMKPAAAAEFEGRPAVAPSPAAPPAPPRPVPPPPPLPPSTAPPPTVSPPRPPKPTPRPRPRRRQSHTTPAPRATPSSPPSTPDSLATARRLFSRGRLQAAEEAAREAIEAEPLNEDAYRLLYCIQLEMEQEFGAQETIAKLLYLDADDVTARYHLARSLARSHDPQSSAREFHALLRRLRGRAPSALIPESDGMTYGMLAKLAEDHLKRMEG